MKETKVQLADGRELSFGDLVEEYRLGKRNFTFTITREGSVRIAEIKNPRLTKQNASLVKVVLDSGHEIQCTPDHRFMLLDGSYCSAEKLVPGISLMPGYFRLSQKEENPEMAGYKLIFQPILKKWGYCHQFADLWNLQHKVYARDAGRVRHHIDFNKLNNNPTNIRRMHWGAHLKLHSEHAADLHHSEEYRAKIAQGRKLYWEDPQIHDQYAKRLSERNKEQWKDPIYRSQKSQFLSIVNKEYIKKHPEIRKEYSRRASLTLKRLWKDPEYRKLFHEKIVASNKRRVTNNTGKAKFLRICHEAIAEYQALTKEFYEVVRQNQFGKGFTTWEKGIKKYFNDDLQIVYEQLCHNHKVVHIENLHETADVYDLTVEKTHNFLLAAGVFVHNSVDGDNAAHMRYTEAKLAKIAEEMLQDLDKETVAFAPNFDGSLQEPLVLPAKLPNLLVNGSSGIAVGMATNIPPHNLKEVCLALIHLIDNPQASLSEIMQHIQGPDFPTGGQILGRQGIIEAYQNGRGKIHVKSKMEVEAKGERSSLIIQEIPYMVNKSTLLEQMADQVRNKHIEGISDIRDESDREGMRIVIELKKSADPKIVENQLNSHTNCSVTFGIIMLALVDNQPVILPITSLLHHYLGFRRQVVRKRTEYDLRQTQEKAHLLEGLTIALDHLDLVIALIRKSPSPIEAKVQLVKDYSLTEVQAGAILDMKLQRLAALEQKKIREEHKQLLQKVKELQEILESELRILSIIKQELQELIDTYGDERRTQIVDGEDSDMDVEDLIAPEDVVITITQAGYAKRLPMETYKLQNRGGKGVIGAGVGEEDLVEHIFIAHTHAYLLVFTDQGNVHWLKVHQVPEASRQAKGRVLANLLDLSDEKIAALIPVKTFDDQHNLFMATQKGIVKKTNLSLYSNPRKGGIIALGIEEGDKLVNVILTDGNQQILMATREGMAVRFHEKGVRPMGRTATGVRGIKLKGEDKVIGLVTAPDNKTLLTVTEKGYGKRTDVGEYREINRGGSGVRNILCTDKNGKVVSVGTVEESDEIIIVSKNGIIIRVPVNSISVIGRNTQGVRIMKMHEGDSVKAVAKIMTEK
ncbi:MAG: DNA gyrase subunit A [Nanoarchaeota archaeon]